MPEDIPVQVALRCRPLVPRESLESCQFCVQFVPGEPQIILGSDKSFTYDFVFNPNNPQRDVYENAVKPLVHGIFKGYNATVLAYGQTGSGKTYTMGGGHTAISESDDAITGVIPRVIEDLYSGIKSEEDYSFVVKVSYMELYKEDLVDLLSSSKKKDLVSIREDIGGIKLVGLTERLVENGEEMLNCLEAGSHERTTGSTAMNDESSRSHAIFTIHIERTCKDDSNDFCKAKFHLVDLAGSERAKRTQAEGERFKEGININKGLLCLGNVISALGDETQKRTHIPYRDSKLTRLLQDSLGGNSHTLMIACVSPADSNMEETLSTLRYADRARRIKNKPIVNRDPQAAEILRLKQLVQDLQMQLLDCGKTPIMSGGKTTTPTTSLNLQRPSSGKDHAQLKRQIEELEAENRKLSEELQASVDQNTTMCEKLITVEMAKDKLTQKLQQLKEKIGLNVSMLNNTCEADVDNNKAKEHLSMAEEIRNDILNLEDIEDDNLMDIGINLTEAIEETNSPFGSPNQTAVSEAATKQHVLQQAKLSRQLQELNAMLSKKEQLMSQMVKSDDQMNSIKEQYENGMRNLECEVENLQKEKEQLQCQLFAAKTNSAGNKVSEQRRKRLKELEDQLTQVRKKMTEQSKMLKMKEQTDKQIKHLFTDINGLKQQRVKLMKQLKEDGNQFRKWKQEKDKEVMQLKAKDRKREIQMVKMERKHEQQELVLRRKAEEAAAANKRLKDALCRQKTAAQDRANKQEGKDGMPSIGQRVRKWLGEELEVLVSIEEVKRHLASLIDDRKELSEDLQQLKRKLGNTPPAKKFMGKKIGSDEDRIAMRAQIHSAEKEIDLRNVQITDLQQKLMDAEPDDKVKKSRWSSNIHTMVEAHCAMKWLLDSLVSSKSLQSRFKEELTVNKLAFEEALKGKDEALEEMKTHKQQHDEEMLGFKAEYQNKVLFLLNQLKNSTSENLENTLEEDIKERLNFQQGEIEKLSSLQEELEKRTEECQALKKDLTIANYKMSNNVKRSLMPPYEGSEASFFSPSLCKGIAANKRRTHVIPAMTSLSLDSEEEGELEEINDDNVDSDPDWQRGRTPAHMYKNTKTRSSAEEPRQRLHYEIASTSQNDNDTAKSQMTCNCKSGCLTARCSCRKGAAYCHDSCGCSMKNLCKNREPQLPESTTDQDSISHKMSETFCVSDTISILEETTVSSTAESSDQSSVLQDSNTSTNSKKRKSGTKRPSEPSTENTEPTSNVSNNGVIKRRKKLLGSQKSFFPGV